MAESLVVEWLNENYYRAYPLKEGLTPVVIGQFDFFKSVLDACLVYSTLPVGAVHLYGFGVNGYDLNIYVTGQSVFTITNYKTATYPYYVRNTENSLLVLGEECKSIPNTRKDNLTFEFEESVCFETGGAWEGVSSIAFNDDATLTGEINFKEGYQFDIGISGKVLSLEAGKQYGIAIDCTKYFELTNDCSNLVGFINGTGVVENPGDFSIIAGENISIFSDKPNHRIYIGFNFSKKSDICQDIIENPMPTI